MWRMLGAAEAVILDFHCLLNRLSAIITADFARRGFSKGDMIELPAIPSVVSNTTFFETIDTTNDLLNTSGIVRFGSTIIGLDGGV